MGKATKIVLFGALGMVGFIAAMQSMGDQLESEFAAQQMADAGVQPAPSAEISEAAPASPSPSPMTEDQRLALAEVDPEMKAASDFVGALINVNGHLCARVSNVVPAGAGKFEVTCVKHSDGRGRAKYLVDGGTNAVTPL